MYFGERPTLGVRSRWECVLFNLSKNGGCRPAPLYRNNHPIAKLEPGDNDNTEGKHCSYQSWTGIVMIPLILEPSENHPTQLLRRQKGDRSSQAELNMRRNVVRAAGYLSVERVSK